MKINKSEALFLYAFLWNQKYNQTPLDSEDENRMLDLLDSAKEFLTSFDDGHEECDDDYCDDCGNSSDEDGDLYLDEVVVDVDDVEDDDSEDEDDVDESNEDEDLEENEEPSCFVSATDLSDLPKIKVTDEEGNKVSIEFDANDTSNSVDVLLDEGSVIIDEVRLIRLTSTSIEIHDGDDWLKFTFKKAPKTWANLFELDSICGVETAEEE